MRLLYDEDQGEFEVLMALDRDEIVRDAVGKKFILDEGGLTGWVMSNRQPLLIKDMQMKIPLVVIKEISQQVD